MGKKTPHFLIEATLTSGAKVQFACEMFNYSEHSSGTRIEWKAAEGVYPQLKKLSPGEIVAWVILSAVE